jgi:Na+/H+ antiporter NhaD/arsenite permease-like protein
LPSAEQAVKHKAYFRYTCWVLALSALAYLVASAVQCPLSLVAMSGALLLLVGSLHWRQTAASDRRTDFLVYLWLY